MCAVVTVHRDSRALRRLRRATSAVSTSSLLVPSRRGRVSRARRAIARERYPWRVARNAVGLVAIVAVAFSGKTRARADATLHERVAFERERAATAVIAAAVVAAFLSKPNPEFLDLISLSLTRPNLGLNTKKSGPLHRDRTILRLRDGGRFERTRRRAVST